MFKAIVIVNFVSCYFISFFKIIARRGIAIAETSRILYIATSRSETITSVLIGEGSTIPGNETEFADLGSGEPISLEVSGG